MLEPVLATLERSLVLRNFGRLEEEDPGALREVLRAILGEYALPVAHASDVSPSFQLHECLRRRKHHGERLVAA